MNVELTKLDCLIIHQALKDYSWSICEILEEHKKNKTESLELAVKVQIREKQFCQSMAVLEKFEELNPLNILF